MPKKLLNLFIACEDCNIECEPTEDGILCPKCGGYISNKQIDELGDYGSHTHNETVI